MASFDGRAISLRISCCARFATVAGKHHTPPRACQSERTASMSLAFDPNTLELPKGHYIGGR
jgi:hypothetical protein